MYLHGLYATENSPSLEAVFQAGTVLNLWCI